MKDLALALCVVMVMGRASVVHADLIEINANDYAVGTILADQFEGLSLSYLSQSVTGSAFYGPARTPLQISQTRYGDAIGSWTFGLAVNATEFGSCYMMAQLGLPSGQCNYRVLELLFDTPTDVVEIESVFFSDGPDVYAFNAQGSEVARCWAGRPCSPVQRQLQDPDQPALTTTTVSSEQGDIARVIFGGITGRSEATKVRYAVSEPGTVLLVGVGLLMAASFAKHRARKT